MVGAKPGGKKLGISTWQLLFVVLYCVILLLPFWQIFKKAGFTPWFSLLILVPVVNLLVLYFLGFARWPALNRA